MMTMAWKMFAIMDIIGVAAITLVVVLIMLLIRILRKKK